MAQIQQQVLVCEEHVEEIAELTRALDHLRAGEITSASRVLMERIDRLQEFAKPRLMLYDPRLENVVGYGR